MPEWVSAQQIPGVWRLGRRDEADTPDLSMLMRDNGPLAPKYQDELLVRLGLAGEGGVARRPRLPHGRGSDAAGEQV